MIRSILCGLLALVCVGTIGSLPIACQSGGVGDPCTPELEYEGSYAGFDVHQAYTESRSFQCSTRICLVNHFQGRVSCPQGQGQPTTCSPTSGGCAAGEDCVTSDVYSPVCTQTTCPANDATCVPCPTGLSCTGGVCVCSTAGTTAMYNQIQYTCEKYTGAEHLVMQSFVCHKPGSCQTVAGGTTTENKGKDCCIPGTDTPVSVPVCGQCGTVGNRDANDAVYCSCRCCAPCCPVGADGGVDTSGGCSTDKSTCGPACDPAFNYCTCPSGFSCSNISQDLGLGNKNLAGAYCIKTDTAYVNPPNCGEVVGYTGTGDTCLGSGTSATAADGGS